MDITLLKLFEKEEQQFRQELSAIRLPGDIGKLQLFMNNFFINKVSVDEYKKELSVTEVAMFNSVLKLISHPISFMGDEAVLASPGKPTVVKERTEKKVNQPRSIMSTMNLPVVGATAIGGIIGGLAFKTWGGVLLSIAGCALGMYISSTRDDNPTHMAVDKVQQSDMHLNIDKYINTLKQICKSIDDVMENYHISISNIEHTYTPTSKTTLASTYKPLLDRMASLYVALANAKLPDDLQAEFDKLYRTLKNLHYEVLGYSEELKQYFVETASAHVSEITLIKAAILENGKLIETGECLVPENNNLD